ncbi:uncharacterized protein LOC143364220 [Halictus rubicundus]|uniref:uncharacterized protein LOC143364220 n=1 Tax=Halictus rubicundus TaxID=77578 RepID=UPI004036FC41
MGISRNIFHFIANWSYCRFAWPPSFHGMRVIYKGLPQGGVLSPLLYNLYVANIFQDIPKKVHISQYADDIAIYTRSSSLEEAKTTIEKSFEKVRTNLSAIGLDLSSEKTNIVVFNNGRLLAGRTQFRLGTTEKTDLDSAKFLGIHFDNRLNFKAHILSLHNRCLRTMNIIKFLRGVWWGAHPDTLIVLCKALIRSRLDYASHIYFPSQQSLITKLESIQVRALKLALGLRTSAPTNVVLAEAGLPYFENRASFLGKTHLIKITSNVNHISNRYIKEFDQITSSNPGSLLHKASNVLMHCISNIQKISHTCHKDDNFPCIAASYNAMNFQISCDLKTGLQLQGSPFPNTEFIDHIKTHYPNHLCIFTDGSKVQGGLSTGAGIVCLEGKFSLPIHINPTASVYTAECAAISIALDLFNNSDKPLLICSDSLSALTSLNNASPNTRTNYHIIVIKQKTYNLTTKFNNHKHVSYIWIPAHSGIHGNEVADNLAKEATKKAPSLQHKIPYTDYKEFFKNEMWNEFQSLLRDRFHSKGVKYFQQFFNPHKKPWYRDLDLPRELIVRFGRMRTNHVNTHESLAKLKIIQHATCECSHPTQDVDHLIWYCPHRRKNRNLMVSKLLKNNWKPLFKIDTFLKNLNATVLNPINTFCAANNIFL